MRTLRRILLTATSLLVVFSAPTALCAPAPKKPVAPTNDDCLACHEDASQTRGNGQPLRFGKEEFGESVHGQAGLSCVDCHADLAKTQDFPHDEKLAKVACTSCHEDAAKPYALGVHAQAHERNKDSAAATCADCHGSHDVFGAKDTRSRVYHLNLPATCGKCHRQAGAEMPAKAQMVNVKAFDDSIHGKALSKGGLLVAPNCANCHGHHDVRSASDPESRVFRKNVPATCGTCHEGIRTPYETSIHGTSRRGGNRAAAVCSDCHSAHAIEDPTLPAWRLEVVRECGTCHAKAMHTYRKSFHGKVTKLGFARVATCADCHGSHEVFGLKDPRALVHPDQRAKTCARCHPGATASFAAYDPHADAEDKDRSPLLYYTGVFMKMLLGGVFVFFLLHTVLWFPRAWKTRASREAVGE